MIHIKFETLKIPVLQYTSNEKSALKKHVIVPKTTFVRHSKQYIACVGVLYCSAYNNYCTLK